METLKPNAAKAEKDSPESDRVQMIAAVQKGDRGIGHKGKLLYRIREDLRRFKELTEKSGTVIMGYATWESLPASVRPLPNRHNIVLTSRELPPHDMVHTARSVQEALEIAKDIGGDSVSVIGGGQVYDSFLPHADTLEITEIAGDKEADTFFPEFEDDFTLTAEEDIGVCTFRTYTRKSHE